MKDDSPLSFIDLSRMDQLLKTSGSTYSKNGQLVEIDWLAIKTIFDMHERPNRTIYNLRMLNYQIESTQNASSEKLPELSLKR